jgi:hypothetical protein
LLATDEDQRRAAAGSELGSTVEGAAGGRSPSPSHAVVTQSNTTQDSQRLSLEPPTSCGTFSAHEITQ